MTDDAAQTHPKQAARHRRRRGMGWIAALRPSALRRTVAEHRSNRRAVAAAVVAVLALTSVGVAVVAAGMRGATPVRPVPAGDSSTVTPAAIDRPVVADPAAVPATPEALLELLTRLLKPAKTSAPAKSDDGRLRVQIYVDDGRGPGMIRLGISAAETAPPCRPNNDPPVVCHTLPDGSRASIVVVPDNCERRVAVSVYRPSGIRVDVDVASCLEFDGTTNPEGRRALNGDQAVALAADRRWGDAMNRDLVAAGARNFKGVRRTSLPGPAEPAAEPTAPQPIGSVRPGPDPVPVTEGGLQWEDVDGDRGVDYCRRISPAQGRTGRVACTLSAGGAFGRTITSPRLDVGASVGRDWEDVNGDNRTDYCRQIGRTAAGTGRLSCTLFTGTAFGETVTSGEVELGQDVGWAWDDANGDNKVDYCRRLSSVGGVGKIACTLSTGSGFGPTITSGDLDLGQDVGWEWEDANGDDKSDYCRRLSAAGDTSKIACTLSTGSGFGATITSADLDVGQPAGLDWEDANGDDKSDYCRRLGSPGGTGRVACTLSTGSGFGTTITSGDLELGADTGVAWEDTNADKRADYCRLLDDRGRSRLACTPSIGTGFGATVESPPVERGRAAGARWVDFNADQRKDFCRRVEVDGGRGLACTVTTGSGFGATVESAPLEWGFDN